MAHLKIGARGSPLSLAQTGLVARAIEEANPGLTTEIVAITTTGDRLSQAKLSLIGGKGLFTKEIEEALLSGTVDLAIHSAKDLPSELPEGLTLGAVPQRADVRDVLISREGCSLAELPKGAKVGTSGLRRQAQLLAARPDLNIEPIRGNVATRLKKLESEFDATLLAAAGLARLGLTPPGAVFLEADEMLPAVGQGILALELRADDSRTKDILAPLNDEATAFALAAERAFLKVFGSGCQLPVAALALWQGGLLKMAGLTASPDGRQVVCGSLKTELNTLAEAQSSGQALGNELLGKGADKIMEGLGL